MKYNWREVEHYKSQILERLKKEPFIPLVEYSYGDKNAAVDSLESRNLVKKLEWKDGYVIFLYNESNIAGIEAYKGRILKDLQKLKNRQPNGPYKPVSDYKELLDVIAILSLGKERRIKVVEDHNGYVIRICDKNEDEKEVHKRKEKIIQDLEKWRTMPADSYDSDLDMAAVKLLEEEGKISIERGEGVPIIELKKSDVK